ncbi:MAG: hypothetical protein R3B99_19890 [Polyangiales bacterium]|nr:hypothetical protein [Myxococcales bacterium]
MLSHAEDLQRRCASLRDVPLRLAFVRDWLRHAGPDVVVDVVVGTVAGSPREDVGLLVSLALCEESFGALRDEAARTASERGHVLAAQLLGRHPPEEGPGELRVPDFGRGRPLTLGERKSLARRRDRQVLARVLRDPHPEVVRILLGNPALTEEDVVRLAARRPVDPKALTAIVHEPKWAVRPHVRRAIVQNPWTPLGVAMLLVPHLTRPELLELERSADLRGPLREMAAALRRGASAH